MADSTTVSVCVCEKEKPVWVRKQVSPHTEIQERSEITGTWDVPVCVCLWVCVALCVDEGG